MKNQELPPQLTSLRYPGDLSDATTLLNDYGAATIIDSLELDFRLDGKQPWDECLSDAIPLPPALTPRIHALLSDACSRLGLSCSIRLFTLPVLQINAYAFLDRAAAEPVLYLCLTSRALEHLSDSEILFLIGHELGHIVYEHDRMNLLCHTATNSPAPTLLPDMGEWLYLRWRQKAEISADRVGWFLARHIEDGAGAIIKSATDLTDKNLTLNDASIQSFLDEDAPIPHIQTWSRKNAPLFSARLRALRLMEDSSPAKVYLGDKRPAWIQKIDKATSGILESVSRHPDTNAGLACMTLIADAGVELIQRDKEAGADEIKRVLTILHDHFTDRPDKVICMDPEKRSNRIKSALRVVNRHSSSDQKKIVLSRLADIAISDGPFLEEESLIIVDTAKALKIPPHETYAIIVGCIKAAGKEVDPGIQSLAEKLASPAAGM